MTDKPKLIGVCLSQAHVYPNTNFLDALRSAAASEGFDVAIFNSSLDFFWHRKENVAPRAVFRSIRYELFSYLLIITPTMHDDELIGEIVRGAREHGVPVISLGDEFPGCWPIVNDYEQSYKALLRHVIVDHGAKDTFFIAGIEGEPNSETRLRCYREVLEELSLPFSEDQVAYGNYWSQPPRKIIRGLIRRKALPRAVICANDTMAISVCETLAENDYRVPEDVIVTGFDGSPDACLVRPNLTTCGENPQSAAEEVMALIHRIQAGQKEPERVIHSFRTIRSESCGCPPRTDAPFDPVTVFRRSEMLNTHENDLYYKVELMISQRSCDSFLKMVSQSLLPNSALYLNRRFPRIFDGVDFQADSIGQELLEIPFREADQPLTVTPLVLSTVMPGTGPEHPATLFHVLRAGTMVCGFYAARSSNLVRDIQLIKRLSDMLNLVFTIQLGNNRQQMLINSLNNSLYLDPITGLSNLKGLSRWFDDYAARESNRHRPLALSVYCISRYSYIYENYGMADTEELARLVGDRLTSVNSDALFVARISEDMFAIINSADTRREIGRMISQFTANFFSHIESWNASSAKQYYLEVNCGCTILDDGWTASLENLISLAQGEMYLNRMRSSTHEIVKPSNSSSASYSAFSLLMEKNLLRFHFQPIVDARTAQITAYEALMRTDSLIHLSPLEILDIARVYNRLYDVEKATLFGIIDQYVRQYSSFNGCKVFINTIPGHFLTQEDCALLKSRYESYLDCFVFELTEQAVTPEDELERLKQLCKENGHTLIAIDDYGTGHSNIVNVLRYAPHIIKIDRELISGIQNDSNKKLFVRNTIDFAHQNGIRALAEGVETAEELRTVIDLGVDLIQGYFTGRPAERPLPLVSEPIRNMILEENLARTHFDRTARICRPKDGATLDLCGPAMDSYTVIQVPAGRITLAGRESQALETVINVPDNVRAEVTLRNISLKSTGRPTIELGKKADLTLRVEGNNLLNKDGILVPATSRLAVVGNGNLTVQNNRNYSIGIGANCNDAYGTIVIDMDGSLTIRSAGDKVVCLGGGRSAGGGIHLLRGSCAFSAAGVTVLGIGSLADSTSVTVEDASVSIVAEGNDAVGIGTFSGNAAIRSRGQLELMLKCERAAGIGTMNGTGEAILESGSASVSVFCDVGACIGTLSGEYSSRLCGAAVRIHGEGNRVAGFGSPDGACETRIERGFVQGELLAGERMLLGNEHSRVVITGGNVHIFPEGEQAPLSPGGLPLHRETPKTDHYEQAFSDLRGTWTYTADRDADGSLFIWVPAPV